MIAEIFKLTKPHRLPDEWMKEHLIIVRRPKHKDGRPIHKNSLADAKKFREDTSFKVDASNDGLDEGWFEQYGQAYEYVEPRSAGLLVL